MLTRAYSLLTIKSVDAERRIIAGVATTPTPDRMGDIIDPLGVTFKNPLPLLLYHDGKKPVGTVKFQKPTADGITFEASIASIDEPGTLQDRVNEAWQSVKAGLLRGVSIGFRAIEMAFMKDGGVHFLATEVLELSLVAIPANVDAQISTIKSFDTHAPAATGLGRAVTVPPSGVTESPTRKHTMKTISENIADFQKSRTPKAERMSVIMQKAVDEGRTLTEPEKTEYDGLAVEVKDVGEHITRLEALEDSQRQAARPILVTPDGTNRPSRTAVIEVKSTLPPGIEFARYAICLMAARGNHASALEIAKARYPDQSRVQLLLKAAVAGGTTTDETWAGPLVQAQTLVSEFIEYLRPMTIVGKFGTGTIPSLRRVPFNVRIGAQTSGGRGQWVGQGRAKPVKKYDFAAATLYWAKVAAISVISEELVRFSSPSAETLVRDALAGDLRAGLDIDFVDPDKVAVPFESPASIVNGIAALTPSGTDAAAVRADVKQLFDAFINASVSPTTGVFIMPQTLALALSLMTNPLGQPEFPGITMIGGTFFGLPAITSQYATFGSPVGNMLILVNAEDIFLSDDGAITIDASREASIEMDSAPTGAISAGSPLAPVPTEMVSMFQTNSLALRAERVINWQRRRDQSVAWMADVLWGTGSPA